jgi:hypothetical protein
VKYIEDLLKDVSTITDLNDDDFWCGNSTVDVHLFKDEEDENIQYVEVYDLKSVPESAVLEIDCSKSILSYVRVLMCNDKECGSIIDAAVEYWSGFIADPTTSKFDNGTDDVTAMMLFELAKPAPATKRELELFKKTLSEVIEGERPSSISVDYDLDFILGTALSLSGLDSKARVFPVKTTMFIDWENDKVSVSEGYAAPTKTIYGGK